MVICRSFTVASGEVADVCLFSTDAGVSSLEFFSTQFAGLELLPLAKIAQPECPRWLTLRHVSSVYVSIRLIFVVSGAHTLIFA